MKALATWSPRERLMAAFGCKPVDRIPCAFMIFGALRRRSSSPEDYVDRSLAMGLDAFVEIPPRLPNLSRNGHDSYDLYGMPVRFNPASSFRDWREERPGGRRPLARREYRLGPGMLSTAVEMTEDWPHGDRVPIFDDYIVPRGVKRLVETSQDLEVLRDLLADPSGKELEVFREEARRAKAFANDRGVATVGEWGVLFDAACWLCGMEEIAIKVIEEPEFVEELFSILGPWNLRREATLLEAGVDLVVRRAWYETVDFLSPASHRRLVLPWLRREAIQAHQAGARLGMITTSAYTPLLGAYQEAGLDVLIGLDPVQDPRANFAGTKATLAGTICVWGGVNAFVTVEQGTDQEVRSAVEEAVRTLAPGDGFILSPVDNIRDDSPKTWANVAAFVDAWRSLR